MKHQYTRIAAYAMVAAGVWVAIFKSGPEGSRPNEITETLKQRQSKRFGESGEARLAKRQLNERERKLQQLKEQLLEEFPNLRGDPPIPNEENPMYLLNELVQELFSEEDGKGFDNELLAIMGKDAKWDLKTAKAYLDRHQWVFEKLDQIAVLRPSSVYYQRQQEKAEQWRPEAPMLLMDLIRLKIRVTLDEGDEGAMAESYRMREFFAASMLRAEGSPYLNQLMMDCARSASIDAPMDERAYQRFSPLGLYGGSMLGWLEPRWGERLDSFSLSREIRRVWWGDETKDPNVPVPPSFWDDFLEHPDAARDYAQYVSDALTKLEQQDIPTFIKSGFSPRADELSGITSDAAHRAQDSFHEHLDHIFSMARFQNLQTVAAQLRQHSDAGDFLAGALPDNGPSRFPVDPLTGEPYSYDPATRILTMQSQLKGYEFPPVRISKPGDENPLGFEAVAEDAE